MDNEKLFAIKLADNDKKVRDKTISKIRSYVRTKSGEESGFSEEELVKLWKGLHYCMWMCDKALVQVDFFLFFLFLSIIFNI
jgi:ribosomal RNA-processing protein 1